jgi:hypothetical protein
MSLWQELPSARQKLDDNGYVSAFPTELFDRLDQREKSGRRFTPAQNHGRAARHENPGRQ